VSTYHWLLTFHITAAFFFLGAAVAAATFNVLAVTSKRPSDAASYLRLIRRVLPLMLLGMGAALAFGIALWIEVGYSVGAWWIWGAIVLWAISGGLGQRGGDHQEKARQLAESLAAEGDTHTEELRAILRDPRGAAMSYGAGIAVVGILALMIWKP